MQYAFSLAQYMTNNQGYHIKGELRVPSSKVLRKEATKYTRPRGSCQLMARKYIKEFLDIAKAKSQEDGNLMQAYTFEGHNDLLLDEIMEGGSNDCKDNMDGFMA